MPPATTRAMVVQVECDHCGVTTEKWQAEIDRRENSYCSVECSARAQTKGSKQNTAECDYCGETFRRSPSAIGRYGSGGAFCSRECFETQRREKSNLVEVACANCDDLFEVPESRVAHVHYCTDECESEHSHTCPECGRDGFKSLHGVKMHYSRTHGEPYDKVRLEEEYGVPLDWLLTTLHWRLKMTIMDISEELDVGRGWIKKQLTSKGTGYRKGPPKDINRPNILTPDGIPFTRFAIHAVRHSLPSEPYKSWTTYSRHRRIEAGGCDVCDSSEDFQDLEVHHLIPLRYGGTNETWNLITLCGQCHNCVEAYTEGFLQDVLVE